MADKRKSSGTSKTTNKVLKTAVKKTSAKQNSVKSKTVSKSVVKSASATSKPAVKAAAKTKTSAKAPVKAAAAAVKKPVEKAAVKETALKTKKGPLTPREQKIYEIKTNLIAQKDALLNEAESALNELPGQTIFPDLGDQASAETDRNFMLRLRGREQRLLKKIDEAIDRIDSGNFGICEDCGNEIDIKRLQARPVTTMCIECKTLQEEEEKLRET